MMTALAPAIFHQSIRYFQPGKAAISWNSADAWTNQQRMAHQPGETPPDRVAGTFIHQRNFPTDEIEPAGTGAQEHSVDSNRAFKRAADFDHDVFRGAEPIGRSSQSVTFSTNTKKGQPLALPLPFQQGVPPRDNGPMQVGKPAIGADPKLATGKPVDTQTSRNASNLFFPSISQSSLNAGFSTSVADTALPVPAVARTIREPSASKIAAHRDPLPAPTSVPIDVGRHRRDDADNSIMMKAYGVSLPNTIGNIPATPDNHFPPDSNPAATASRHSGTDGALLGSKDVDFGERGSARTSEDTASADQSSNIIGELWLDTLALREWLQTFLTGEIGHALQATNQFGTFVE